MKRLAILLCILSCFIWSLIAKTEYDFSDDTVIVVLTPKISHPSKSLDASFFGDFEKKQVENIFIIHDDKYVDTLRKAGREFRSIYKITLPTHDKAKVREAVEILQKIDGIESATPDYLFPVALAPNDTDYNTLWGLHGTHGVKAPDAWDITTGSSNIRVGVLDTGIASHPDLNANLTVGYDFVNNNTTTTDDTHGHGTHVAGTIGAVGDNNTGVVGVNWDVTLVPLQAANSENLIPSTASISAINWSQGKWGTNEQISVINYSVAGYGEYPVSASIITAINNFLGLFVWASGNGDEDGIGDDVDTYFPYTAYNDLSNVIAVGSITSAGQKSGFSNYSSSGDYVHIFAPGSSINSTWRNNQYNTIDGTSMASPHVSGVAALMLSVNPSLTGDYLKQLMIDSADPIEITTPHGQQTVNRLNAYNAVLLASGQSVISVNPMLKDFGIVMLSQTSAVQTFTVTNTSNTTLTVNTITMTGTNEADFDLVYSGLPWELSGGSSQTFTVSFSPSSIGIKSASISIASTADNSPNTVSLTGAGSSPGFSLPYTQDFNSGTSLLDIDWSSDLSEYSGITDISGGNGNNALMMDVWQGDPTQSATTPIILDIARHTTLSFAYLIRNYSNESYPTLTGNNRVYIEVSTTGSAGTYSVLHEINSTNHTNSASFRTLELSLSDFDGENINIRFRNTWGAGDWFFMLDNVAISTPPSVSLPYTQDFNSGTSLQSIGWGGNLNASSGILSSFGVGGSNALVMRVTGSSTTQHVVTPIIQSISLYTSLSFSYRIRNSMDANPPTLIEGDQVFIEVSTAGTYNTTHEINNTNHITSTSFRTLELPLSTYDSQDIVIRFRVSRGGGDWIFILDNVDITNPSTPPPATFTAIVSGQNVTLNWTAPQNPQDLIGYTLRRGATPLIETPTSSLSFTDEDVSFGVYTYSVRAVYPFGVSEPRTAQAGVYDIQPPTNLVATASGPLTVSLSWEAPASIDGLTHYKLYRKVGEEGEFSPLPANINPLSYTDSGLVDMTTYYYHVTAVFSNGESTPSDTDSATATVKFNPAQTLQHTVGFASVVLSWTAPEVEAHSAALSGYKIMRGESVLETNLSAESLEYADNTAQNGQAYTYSVIALYTNPSGESASVDVSVQLKVFNPPLDLSAIEDDALVSLSWTAPEEHTHLATLSGYKVFRNATLLPDGIITDVDILTYTDSEVVNDTTYEYYVVAVYTDPVGESEPSDTVSATPLTDHDEVIVPVATALVGNYPNPFNPETTIRFALANEDRVNIAIYNINGQLVRSLTNKVYGVGMHQVTWNGRDEHGRTVGSGVYFYRMTTDGYVSVRKMLLMK